MALYLLPLIVVIVIVRSQEKCLIVNSYLFSLLAQVDGSVFESREMVQRLAFGLSFLQRMDMKPVVVMGWSEHTKHRPNEPLAGSECTHGLVGRSQQLTEALQEHSANVLPLFSAESFLLLQETPPGSM